MNPSPKVFIAGIGMVTPLGADAPMTAALVRAGASAYKESDFLLDDDEPVRLARVPQELLDSSLDASSIEGTITLRQARLLQLAKLALTQLAPRLPKDIKLPLFLAGPEQLVEGDRPIDQAFLKNLAQQSGVALDLETSRVISTGRAGSIAAVDLAFRLFAGSDERFALVGGVDTYYDAGILEHLLQNERLLVGKNTDGFIPGEGAAFLLLTRQPVSLPGATQQVSLSEPGLASEPGHRGSPQPYRGDGLAQACSVALAQAAAPKVHTLYSSMNGEHLFIKEHGVAMIRNSEYLSEHLKVEHPADCFGDLGAAFGPVAIGLTAFYQTHGKARTPCLICCSSDKDARAAIVVQV